MSYTGIDSFKEYLKNKEILFWGVGTLAEPIVDKIKEIGITEYKFIDSDPNKAGSTYLNAKVLTPDYLQEFKDKKFVVISCRYISEVEQSLEKLGYKKRVNYIDGVNLDNELLELSYKNQGAKFAIPLTMEELKVIENEMYSEKLNVIDTHVPSDDFIEFEKELGFGNFYRKWSNKAYERKIREYWFAFNLLKLYDYQKEDIYLDVGASTSPWVSYLREQKGLRAYGIDMIEYQGNNKEYYLVQNATNMDFGNGTVSGISLQSAFCLFEDNGDIKFIKECSRILKPGGKLVISPLYMYKEFISGVSARYYGKGYADPEQIEMIRTDSPEIRMSRYYDVKALKKRILDYCEELGMKYTIYILPNEEVLDYEFAYLKFILEIEKI